MAVNFSVLPLGFFSASWLCKRVEQLIHHFSPGLELEVDIRMLIQYMHVFVFNLSQTVISVNSGVAT